VLGKDVRDDPAVTAARVEIRYAIAFAQALYDRRTALGLSQTEVARRARMSQPQISRIEGGDTVPTLPLLERLAAALDSELEIHVVPGARADVRFQAPAA
jgi:transcriptional regulator with XRE-family HTH domain